MIHTKKQLFPLFFLSLLILLTCNSIAWAKGSLEKHLIMGTTMGTTYAVTVVSESGIDTDLLKKQIDARLVMVNQSMSMFSPTSELSRFNSTKAHVPFKISRDFAYVMDQSKRLYNLTNGAWDGTLKPLVDLWGFGTKEKITKAPAPKAINDLLKTIGFNKIEILENALQKKTPFVTLDLGSIAKGFGVDAVALLLEKSGFKSFLVEIGGEVFTRGTKPGNLPWTVGISRPEKGSAPDTLYRSIELKDMALATSGDYRNFVIINNKAYSHIIDPTTGYPVETGVVSASVTAENCTFADGLATALMVMPPEKAVALVNNLKKVECLIVVKKKDGTFMDLTSKGFPL